MLPLPVNLATTATMAFASQRADDDVGKETKSGDDDDKDNNYNNCNHDSIASDRLTATTSWLREHAKSFMDEWTRGGLSRYVDLPMICVLGDTSSGKSSVLSNLIGVDLPSATALTTKCPVLIQLQHTESRQEAFIDILWHEPTKSSQEATSPRQRKRIIEQQLEERSKLDSECNNDEKPTAQTSASQAKSFPPPPPPPKWIPRTINKNIPTEMPLLIQQAQKHILEYRQTIVAPDVICVTLWSPDCEEELTLVDLPGLVQFQHHHEEELLGQVEQLILRYVNNPRSILLPVIAAPTNIHNSKVLHWAKQVDPSTTRTIPVLTKPDLMDPGSETDVLELLQPQQTPSKFHHGFYLVMNRGQAQLDNGTSLNEGLEMEQDYFATTLPWSAVGVPRLGIPALRRQLADVLWQLMQASMPDILKELQAQYEQTQDELTDMGTTLHTRVDQRKFYNALSNRLVAQVATSLSGKGPMRRKKTKGTTAPGNTGRFANISSTSSWGSLDEDAQIKLGGAARLHEACNEFFHEIQASSLATISKLVDGASVLVSSPGQALEVHGEIVHMAATGVYACVDFIDEKDHTTDVLFDGIDYMADQPDFVQDEVWSDDGNRIFIGRSGGRYDSLRKIPITRIRTDPSWLQQKMSLFRTDDLACFINVEMFQHIVADFVAEDWVPPCKKLVDTLQKILTETVNLALQDHIQTSKRFPLLEQMLESICHRVTKNLMETARNQVREHLEMEQEHPYTQDEVLLNAMNKSRFSSLRRDLELQLRLDQEGVVYDTQAIKTILDRVFNKHQRTNWMAEQMELVLSCYGQVATQRVLDRTPQICWQTCRTLPKVLQEELGCTTDDVLETCLWESPASKKKFHDLSQKLEDLQQAMNCLKSIK